MLPDEINELLTDVSPRKKVNHVMSALSYDIPLFSALDKCLASAPDFKEIYIFQELLSDIKCLFSDNAWYNEHRNEIETNCRQFKHKCIPAPQLLSIPPSPNKHYRFKSKTEKEKFLCRIDELLTQQFSKMNSKKNNDYLFIHACKLSQEQYNVLRDTKELEISYSWIYKIAEFLGTTPDYLVGRTDSPFKQKAFVKSANGGMEEKELINAISFSPMAKARAELSQYLSQRYGKELLDLLILLLSVC